MYHHVSSKHLDESDWNIRKMEDNGKIIIQMLLKINLEKSNKESTNYINELIKVCARGQTNVWQTITK